MLYSAVSEPPQNPHFRHFTRGRYALGEAYRLAGLGPDSALLAPAYHCITMLDPALDLGADILLYPLHADLTPDLAGLDRLLHGSARPIKALLATHFFGLVQNFSDLKRWCDQHGIVLVEDCSHVLFTEHFQAAGAGVYGKFVAASPYKFFPCEDGGLLYASESSLLDDVRTECRSPIDELRGIKRQIEKSRSATCLPCEIARIDTKLAALVTKPLVAAKDQRLPYAQPSTLFSKQESRKAALCSSRWQVRHAPINEISQRRKTNFRHWAAAVADLAHCRPLLRELPAECTPYMFPLYIDQPEPIFYWLKHLGFPIWRWDEMAISDCPVALNYRLHLLHLPCHQSLTDEQMAWMAATVKLACCGNHEEPDDGRQVS